MKTKPIIFSSGKSQRNSLRRGTGIALCPERMVSRDIETGELVRLHWDAAPSETMIMMITHAEKWCSPPQARFMELALEVILRDNSA